ncbi:SDR family NAD(P)-dependent oxidoreductase [Zhongshania sp. BJYM1]|jgi:NAD(P)-dependent dehydrogenase (short-subunit alcohol dehydrogenase family)|uniref:SDR family NAD(P)-dependent oxidoreductase n=1 Tax=Zhongshania aquatica TaxID=2965069 RepID=UPI0022B59531|nr:SDR family NAD(P)-dependent oxidoreductase [Marortus sp. BJYM1]
MKKNILDLTGKVALVSGASSGLGEHFAEVLAAYGAVVICTARRVDRLENLAAKIQANGGKAYAVEMDVTDRASVKRALDKAEELAGVPAVVVCNAGATGGQPFLEMEEAVWDHVLDVNVKGVFNLGQEAAQRMVAAGIAGSIVNISSICGTRTFPGLAHYSSSKAAVDHLTRSMAQELAPHNVRVNAIAPGYFLTDLTADYYATEAGQKDVAGLPLSRLGKLEELDGQLLLLSSDAASFMSGGVYTVDSGHSIRLG